MFAKVRKSGEFKANKKDENENIQYYAGSENQLAMKRFDDDDEKVHSERGSRTKRRPLKIYVFYGHFEFETQILSQFVLKFSFIIYA